MNLEYFLLCKNNYDSIISKLDDIIENYTVIFLNTELLDTSESNIHLDKFIPKEFIQELKSRLNYAQYCRNYCLEKIHELCVHEFITDTIDIDPDKSNNITYCKICEYTKT